MATFTRNYEYRLRTNQAFVTRCEQVLRECCWLYNQSLAEWKKAWGYRQSARPDKLLTILALASRTSAYDQQEAITVGRATGALEATINRSIHNEVLDRREKASQAFFRRVKAGETPGSPRFRSVARYSSFAVTIDPRHRSPLQGDKLTVASIGTVRVRLSRPLPAGAIIKQVRIIRRADGWYAVLTIRFCRETPARVNDEVVGLDVGITNFAALSNGKFIENPRCGEAGQAQLTARSQRLAKKPKRQSKRRDEAKRLVAQAHLKVARQRKHFHYETIKTLLLCFGVICIEDLKIRNLVRNHSLARVISDVAWGAFFGQLIRKAEEAGGLVLKVPPHHTSQTCPQCGCVDARNRPTQAVFKCISCGYANHADTVGGINIRSRGLVVWHKLDANRKAGRATVLVARPLLT